MSFRLKFNLVLLSTVIGMLLISAVLMYHTLRKSAFEELQRVTRTQMEMALSIRKYTNDHIKPILAQNPDAFFQESVPSFAATQLMHMLHQKYPGFTYREVALNPQNPANQAQPWEAEVVEYFRQTKADEYYFEHQQPEKEAMVHYARPLIVTDAACLTCHGNPAHAPAAMLRKYGTEHGFGWQLGEIIGAQITSVPMRQPLHEARETFLKFLLGSGLVFAVVYLVLNVMLRRAVLSPMEDSHASLERLASEDALTGIMTRRKFMEVVGNLMTEAQLNGTPLSLVIMDIDHFKKINDTWGHDVGDEVLKEVVARCHMNSKRRDVFARFGGEEFIFALAHSSEDTATTFAHILRSALSNKEFGDVGQVTASFGVAQMQPDEPFESLFKRADLALYQAKQNGRNTVTAHSRIEATTPPTS